MTLFSFYATSGFVRILVNNVEFELSRGELKAKYRQGACSIEARMAMPAQDKIREVVPSAISLLDGIKHLSSLRRQKKKNSIVS